MSPGPVSIVAIGTVAVPSADADRSLAFYVGLLGFRKVRDLPFGDGQRWVEVAPPEGTTTIAIAPAGSSRVGIDTGIRLTTADAASDHAELSSLGADVDPEMLHYPGVPTMFSLRDPDGNRLYIVQRM